MVLMVSKNILLKNIYANWRIFLLVAFVHNFIVTEQLDILNENIEDNIINVNSVKNQDIAVYSYLENLSDTVNDVVLMHDHEYYGLEKSNENLTEYFADSSHNPSLG